ncbi:MAG: CoA-binding protein [Bacteroidia bacterium]|nr:CoA-binding protein [Bacteroidia bacterium]
MQNTINNFKNSKNIAIAGISRTKKTNIGNILLTELSKKGYNIYPINPNTNEIDGVKCYNKVNDLPSEVDSIIIATNQNLTDEIVYSVKNTNIKRVWMQKGSGKGSATPESIKFCKDNKIEYVYGICPMMAFGSGGHKFHYWVRKTLGRLPEELKK